MLAAMLSALVLAVVGKVIVVILVLAVIGLVAIIKAIF